MGLQNPRTTSPSRSIFTASLPEHVFRQNLVALEKCCNAIPIDARAFSASEWQQSQNNDLQSQYTLSIEDEQKLADGFAFLAAVEEGAQSVAAVCVEEHVKSYDDATRDRREKITLRFAAMDSMLGDGTVTRPIERICASLASYARHERDFQTSFDAIFDETVKLHKRRLLARLRSGKWEKPKFLSRSHKKALWADLENLKHRVQFYYGKGEKRVRLYVERAIDELRTILETYEMLEDLVVADGEAGNLSTIQVEKQLIHSCRIFCGDATVRGYIRALESSVKLRATSQVSAAIKTFRQLEKIAAYEQMCRSLLEIVALYPAVFENGMNLEYLVPYAGVPTDIGYESWATTCHVHAEVQLVVYYDLQDNGQKPVPKSLILRPRCIGISKWLCYLCFKFLETREGWFPSKTHGRLYDQWTVPDLAEFDDTLLNRYRDVLNRIDAGIRGKTESLNGKKELWRVEPMTSRQDLLFASVPSTDSRSS